MNKGKQKGITLIALIITIIIMLILVAVTVSVAVNGNLFGKAEEAVDKTNAKVGKLQQDIDYYTGELNNASDRVNEEEHNWSRNGETFKCLNCRRELKIGQQIMYTDSGTSTSIVTTAKSGIKSDQTIPKASDIKWVVFGIEDSDGNGTNESLLLTTVEPVPGPRFAYPNGYNNGEEELNRVCKELYGSNARSMTLADIENTLQYRPSGAMYAEVTEETETVNGVIQTTFNYNWKTTGNFRTKLNQLEIWDAIKTASTNTPDGANTETALGNYTLNGYTYFVATNGQLTNSATSETQNISNVKRDLIFGTNNAYDYFLASKIVGATTEGANFALANISYGNVCGGAMLAQANQSNQGVLSLLGETKKETEINLVALNEDNMQNAKIERCAMIVQHNLSAMNSNRQLGITNTNSSEKLSSGYRISNIMRPVVRITNEPLTVGGVITQYGDGKLNSSSQGVLQLLQ